ncbi:hypothetical protein F5X68DRAFT_250227 [Plectosphaerella plurivora]|uniref:CBM1 domain-containing protein n=1 Tax=Plectosphaerella plurivora TaxID=936078 RepID=A0A9P9A555_9PEZI|nr:hypothetical protein F5X68DRAFT_250227 [Plectosphaerella plurivora]
MPSLGRLLFGLLAVSATATAQCIQQPSPRFSPQMASGYQSRLILNGLQTPRHLVFDTHGALLIASAAGIQHLRLSEASGTTVCVTQQRQLISNARLSHGIALSGDGRTLYVSSATEVFAYPYDPAAGTVGSPRTLITIPTQGGYHQTRTLFIPRNNPNTLLVSVGSEDNLDMATTSPSTGRSIIRAFDLPTLTGSAVTYNSGALLGWGLRNSVGIGENPRTGEIWSVENGLDNMMRGNTDVHNDSPGEELNFHGRVNDTNGRFFSANYGYPNCHAVWDNTVIPGFQVGSQVVQGQPSGQFNDAYCQSQPVAPRITFPSHTAPLDVKFAPDGLTAYVAFHGSWNRSPADGYRLSRIDFGADGQPVQPSNSRSAEVRVMQNPNNSACPSGCFRPVGLAWDRRVRGRIFMTSDSTGELYVVVIPGGGCQAQRWGQCGGQGWTGCTSCVSPWTCQQQNAWYSQCL